MVAEKSKVVGYDALASGSIAVISTVGCFRRNLPDRHPKSYPSPPAVAAPILGKQRVKQLLANMKIRCSRRNKCRCEFYQAPLRRAIEYAECPCHCNPLRTCRGDPSPVIHQLKVRLRSSGKRNGRLFAIASRSEIARAASAGAGRTDSQSGGAEIHARTTAGVIGLFSSSHTTVGMQT